MYLPDRVEIVEVCPRDGFQNVKDFIPTKHKVEIIKKLIYAGYKRIEITSFVNPRWVPQMKDADEVVQEVKKYVKDKDIALVALVPNIMGFENAAKAGVDQVTFVISVSETHNKKNVNKTVEESFAQFEEIAKNKDNQKVRLALSTALGCPFGEEIKTEKITYMVARGLEAGADEIIIADTVGLGNPVLVDNVLKEVVKHIHVDKICMHLHDTRGLALANTVAAMQNGVYKFESSAGGLGGCPFAPGASGNVATEDLANMLTAMGIDIDIEENKLTEAVNLIRRYVKSPVISHIDKLCICIEDKN